MKYTIEGFNQEVLLMYKCDPTDAVILRFVVDFWHSGKMTIRHHKGREYFWLDYKYLLQEIPIIGITSKVALKRRFTRFVDVGLMRFYLHHGHLPCYRFTKKYTKLVFKNDSTKPRHSSDTREGGKLKSAGGVNPKVQGGDRLGLPMYSSIIDPSIKIKKREGETLLQEKDSPALSQDKYSSNGPKKEKTGEEKEVGKAKSLDVGSRGYAGEEENVRLSFEEYQKLLKKYPEEFVRLKIAGGGNPKVQGGDRLGLPMYSSIIDPSIKIKKREGETLLQEKDSP
ncbi:MAG: hypothetical protein GY797_35285, partial [Deltaproteobacteria bacterium]|nr:hypothetical protein [Deltaproteobacteria bacterium]